MRSAPGLRRSWPFPPYGRIRRADEPDRRGGIGRKYIACRIPRQLVSSRSAPDAHPALPEGALGEVLAPPTRNCSTGDLPWWARPPGLPVSHTARGASLGRGTPGDAHEVGLTKVLIVDDDRTMVSLLKTLFEIQGYQVLTALQEDAVLASLRGDMPDVVFMDVFLSGLDGLDLLRQIRAAKDLEGLRVIMTSGMDVSDACLEAGANAFLLKPYTPDQLLELIQQNVPPPGTSPAKGG